MNTLDLNYYVNIYYYSNILCPKKWEKKTCRSSLFDTEASKTYHNTVEDAQEIITVVVFCSN